MYRQMIAALSALIAMVACEAAITPSPTMPTDILTLASSTGAISGRVGDAVTNAPITGASITTAPPTSAVISAADGSYTISDVPPGQYTVMATVGGKVSTGVSVRVDADRITRADVPVLMPLTLAEHGVTRNAVWTPYAEERNGALMALAPKGCFMMGSSDDANNEKPAHRVCFERPFWFDVYKVTQEKFARLGGEAVEASDLAGDNRPRENVTWSEADAFCRKRGLRLPTEAEWEYAARGPDALRYPWGNAFADENTQYSGIPVDHTWDVGSRPGTGSWLGVYNLTGNIGEWTADWYSETYYSTVTDGMVNPIGPEKGKSRVVRGGSWSGTGNFVRAAYRSPENPDRRSGRLGFRCAGMGLP